MTQRDLLLVAVSAIAGIGCTFSCNVTSPRALRTQRVEIVDEQGRVRIILGVPERGKNDTVHQSVTNADNKLAPSLWIYDDSGALRGHLGQTHEGSPGAIQLLLRDGDDYYSRLDSWAYLHLNGGAENKHIRLLGANAAVRISGEGQSTTVDGGSLQLVRGRTRVDIGDTRLVEPGSGAVAFPGPNPGIAVHSEKGSFAFPRP